MALATDPTKHLLAHQIANCPVSIKLHSKLGGHFHAYHVRRYIHRVEHIASKRTFRSNGVTAYRLDDPVFG